MSSTKSSSSSPSLLSELRSQASGALPISATYASQFIGMLISQTIAGHISQDALAAVALAGFWANVTGNAPLVGLAFGADSLLPQAVGAKNYVRAGHTAQRATIALLLAAVAIFPLWWFAGAAFGSLGQDAGVVAIAGPYVRWLSVGLPAMALFEIEKKLLNAAGFFAPPLVLSVIALGVQGALAYALAYGGADVALGLPGGVNGAALAYAIGQWSAAIGCAVYLAIHRRFDRGGAGAGAAGGVSEGGAGAPLLDGAAAAADVDGLGDGAKSSPPAPPPRPHDVLAACLASPLTWRALADGNGWATFFTTALPAVFMMIIEWGAFEALAVVAGTISPATQAAHSVLALVEFLLITPIFGFMLGASLRCGSLMGARDAAGARRAAHAVVLLAATYAVVAAAVIAAAHAALVPVFTSPDSDAGRLVARYSFFVCGVIFFDSLQGTAGGVLRGAGRPVVGALSSIVSYVFVGLPLSWLLSKTLGLGLAGIWIGVIASVITAFAIMGTALARQDWEQQTALVADLAETEERERKAAAAASEEAS